jgi:hypothetical protein
MTASASGLTSTGASTAFNVTVQVKGTTPLTDMATDLGSGVKQVTYYYCSGLSGACTSSNWHLIGTSSTSGTWAFSWTTASQPVDGAYEVVAVGTDNVTNSSSSSTSVPVTVNN